MKLRDIAKTLGLSVGCSDSGCIWGAPDGMATNGGCRCLVDSDWGSHPMRARINARALARVAQHLADLLTDDGWYPAAVAAQGSVARLTKERDELRHRESQALTDSEAFRAGVVAALTDREALLVKARGWGSLEEYVEKQIAPLRAEIDAAWAATGVAAQVRGLTSLADVVATQRAAIVEMRSVINDHEKG